VREYRLISAVTFAFGTDGINRVVIVKAKLIDDGARRLECPKGFFAFEATAGSCFELLTGTQPARKRGKGGKRLWTRRIWSLAG